MSAFKTLSILSLSLLFITCEKEDTSTDFTEEHLFTTGIEGPAVDAAKNLYAVNFEKEGSCKHGKDCKFAHEVQAPVEAGAQVKMTGAIDSQKLVTRLPVIGGDGTPVFRNIMWDTGCSPAEIVDAKVDEEMNFEIILHHL